MTKNRARIRATKALAGSSDIRHPDASYLADHRKLRLPDGIIHDFSEGPLHLTGDGTTTARSQAEDIRIRAEEKKWRVAQVGAGAPTPGILDFAREKPCLVVIQSDGTAPANTLAADMAAGAYPNLNIVVVESFSPTFLKEFPGSQTDGAPLMLITGGPGSGRNAGIRAQIEAADAGRDALIALGIPQAAQKFATHANGLFLVTGATGSGKTMTGATLLRRAHHDKGCAAAAIMLPCEMLIAEYPGVSLHPAEHANETAAAIKKAVADGTKIIFVDTLLGDPESTEAVLDAALGGAMVIATMHTKASDAAQRLLDAFPNSGNPKIRAKVELALRGVIEQVLVRGESGTGRVLTSEVWAEGDNDSGLAPVLTFQESLEALVAEGTVLQADADRARSRRW